jgi:hypothetical protein
MSRLPYAENHSRDHPKVTERTETDAENPLPAASGKRRVSSSGESTESQTTRGMTSVMLSVISVPRWFSGRYRAARAAGLSAAGRSLVMRLLVLRRVRLSRTSEG